MNCFPTGLLKKARLEGECALLVLPGSKDSLASYLVKRVSLAWVYSANGVVLDPRSDEVT